MSLGRGRRASTRGQSRTSLASLPTDRTAVRAQVTRWLVGRSSYLYGPGDMRRAYRWTRDAVLALLVAAGVVLAGRLLLTTLFATHVSAEPPLLAAFNLGLTVTAATTVFGLALVRRRARRWWRYRRAPGAGPPPGPL